jgi:hypothetical protein
MTRSRDIPHSLLIFLVEGNGGRGEGLVLSCRGVCRVIAGCHRWVASSSLQGSPFSDSAGCAGFSMLGLSESVVGERARAKSNMYLLASNLIPLVASPTPPLGGEMLGPHLDVVCAVGVGLPMPLFPMSAVVLPSSLWVFLCRRCVLSSLYDVLYGFKRR